MQRVLREENMKGQFLDTILYRPSRAIAYPLAPLPLAGYY